jgi:hypothetical protein
MPDDRFDIAFMQTDSTKEVEGVWFEYPGGLHLRIARNGNPRFQKAVMQKQRDLKQQARFSGGVENMNPEDLRNAIIKPMAKYILTDWKGMTEDGEEIPYSPAEAERLLKKYSEFFDLVDGTASDVENFRVVEEETTRGNSSGSSSGSATTAGTSTPIEASSDEPDTDPTP